MIRTLADEVTLAEVLAAPAALLYKHSPRCGVCIASEREVHLAAAAHPDVPVFQLDVVAHRPLAREASRRLGLAHESPQVVLVMHGRPVWWASHWDVHADAIAEQLAALHAG
jgi:bacillithiol system protein YtxJ